MAKRPSNYLDLNIKDDNPKWIKFIDYFNQRWEESFKEPGHFEYQNRFDDVHIISKKFGFVTWLVKKHKLDMVKVGTLSNMGFWDQYNSVDTVIMLLSIQNNPITFIFKILK